MDEVDKASVVNWVLMRYCQLCAAMKLKPKELDWKVDVSRAIDAARLTGTERTIAEMVLCDDLWGMPGGERKRRLGDVVRVYNLYCRGDKKTRGDVVIILARAAGKLYRSFEKYGVVTLPR